MLEHGDQWIQWKRNPPTTSNMGGVWEHQIRSASSVLVALLKIHGTSLNYESLDPSHQNLYQMFRHSNVSNAITDNEIKG